MSIYGDAEDERGVHVIPLSGGEPELVIRGGQTPSWSPDGKRLAVGQQTPGPDLGVRLATFNADGTNQQILTRGSHVDFHRQTAWSPDGSRIVFVNGRYRDRFEMFVIPSGGGEPRSLTGSFRLPNDPEPEAADPDW